MPINTTKTRPALHVRKGDTLVFKGKGFPVLRAEAHRELPDHVDITLGDDVLVPQSEGGFKRETQALQSLAIHQNAQVEVPA